MTIELTMPIDPTERPAGPDRIEVEPLHLSITECWDSGSSHNIHLLENGDLGVILARGQDGHRGIRNVPSDAGQGTIVITVGVDGQHDEVHYTCRGDVLDVEELLGQAIETLVACRYTINRAHTGVEADERNAFELGRDYERGHAADESQ